MATFDVNKGSAIENYYIIKKLPDFGHIKPTKKITKNAQYYYDNFNIWNNSHQASKKNYQYFHAQNDANQPRIEQMKDMQILDKIRKNEQIKEWIN